MAHLVDSLHPDGDGYGLVPLAGAAAKADLELVVVGISGSGDGRRSEALRRAGATVVELGLAPWDPRAVPKVAEVLRAHRAALVHTHAPNADVAGSAAATRLRIPVVSTLHRIEDEPAARLDRLRRSAKTLARRRFVTRTIATPGSSATGTARWPAPVADWCCSPTAWPTSRPSPPPSRCGSAAASASPTRGCWPSPRRRCAGARARTCCSTPWPSSPRTSR
ncbi:glycosyltransferase [Pseudonocardia ailaonensis]|uniref:glycosyltransferase n=1 Tax=Pseudonocardia ailaonensis TaxID=367279 RepID=UPI0031D9A252